MMKERMVGGERNCGEIISDTWFRKEIKGLQFLVRSAEDDHRTHRQFGSDCGVFFVTV
jgi:hypothetical protein